MPSFNLVPTDWSPTGKQIIFSAPTSASGSDLWLLPIGEGGTPAPFIASRAEQMHGNFSPNGGLVAYTSNETGRDEVYLQAYPIPGRRVLVTTSGLESVGGADGLLSMPGLDQTPAARDGRVAAFEDQYLYGLGPRVGQPVGIKQHPSGGRELTRGLRITWVRPEPKGRSLVRRGQLARVVER